MNPRKNTNEPEVQVAVLEQPASFLGGDITHPPLADTPQKCPVSRQSKSEERLNVLTHGLGIVLSLIGLVVLVVASSSQGHASLIVSCVVFGVALVFTYTASTLYHSWSSSDTKKTWRIVDHLSIYILIAGTYTPFTLLGLKGSMGWWLFGFVWGVALLGIVVKFVFGQRFQRLEVILYLAMGWSAIVVIQPLKQNLPSMGFSLLVAGGLAYSLGVVFYVWKRLPYNHAIWHLFVLAGSVCHFFAVGYSFFPAGSWSWF